MLGLAATSHGGDILFQASDLGPDTDMILLLMGDVLLEPPGMANGVEVGVAGFSFLLLLPLPVFPDPTTMSFSAKNVSR